IEIQNFRSLKQLKIEDLKQFNLIIGDTNVGKTTILESFFIATSPGNLGLLFSMNDVRGIDFYDDYFKSFFHFNNTNENIRIRAIVKSKEERERELNIRPLFRDVFKVKDSDLNDGISALSSLEKIDGLRDVFKVLDKSNNIETYDYLFKMEDPKPMGESGKLFREIKRTIEGDKKYILAFNSRYEHTKALVGSLKGKYDLIVQNLKKKDFVEIISRLDPNIIDVDQTQSGITVEYKGFRFSNPIGILGNGIIKIICVIAAILATRGGVILIDEIENGIHYSLLESFWESILETANRESVQIIATTHSYDCIRAFYKSFSNKAEQEQLRVFRIEKTEENECEAIKYNAKNLKVALEENWEVR
ncbi:MAG: ATP/GTP-binding protein, partial [Candidatus Thorarchaeota archaeon]